MSSHPNPIQFGITIRTIDACVHVQKSKWNGTMTARPAFNSVSYHPIRHHPSISPFIFVHSGGYAFFETSQLPDSPKAQNTVSAMLTSPVLKSTGSEGFCVTFSYAMDGLSTDKLRLLLQVHCLKSFGPRWSSYG